MLATTTLATLALATLALATTTLATTTLATLALATTTLATLVLATLTTTDARRRLGGRRGRVGDAAGKHCAVLSVDVDQTIGEGHFVGGPSLETDQVRCLRRACTVGGTLGT